MTVLTDLNNHKKVIAIFLNTLRNSQYVFLIEKIVDEIHRQGIHLAVNKEGYYTEAEFKDIVIIEKK